MLWSMWNNLCINFWLIFMRVIDCRLCFFTFECFIARTMFYLACVVCISSDNVVKSHRGCCLGGIIINHGFHIYLFIENSTIIDIEQFWTKP
jgi:hypothetical protein